MPLFGRSVLALPTLLLLSLAMFGAPAKRPAHKGSLADQINTILSQPDLARAHWGIDVVDLESGKSLYSLNEDQLFLPASNAKLFTTAAALSLAGPDYRFRTTVESAGQIDANGHLLGDLVIVGRGDPNISGRVLPYALKTERLPPHTQMLEDLAGQIAERGVKVVEGDIIGDDTFYAPERYGEGWAQDDLQWPDGAPVSALSFNDNVLFVKIQPGAHDGDKAAITLEPETDYYQIENAVMTAPAGGTRKIGMHHDPGSKAVVIWGWLPENDAGVSEALAVDDPAALTAELLRSLLEQRGITVTGRTRARHGDAAQFFDRPLEQAAPAKLQSGCCPSELHPAPVSSPVPTSGPLATSDPSAATTILAEHVSLPFIEDLRVINKTSQNLHAELALRLAGRLDGAGGSFEGGEAAVKQFLLKAGLREEEFVLLDGSGLSRRDLVTPAAVTRLLIYARHQTWGQAYEESLPDGGVDGSLSERFLNTPAVGLIHAKTGTLSHVSALSGYGQTMKGSRFVFSILCNDYNLPQSKVIPAIDAVVKLLVTQGDTARK
ncbi:MAG TPA: D-alanyl-D-alanine carboxypeptidase/D-alanyl-D-alanine-endopeptidase [Terriglobales bacterium]